MSIYRLVVITLISLIAAGTVGAKTSLSQESLDRLATMIEKDVIAWRRDIHANPELSNREFRTAALVAKHLESLGMEVRTGIAHTGVAALLKGGKPGPVVALRADMDALPVIEQVDVPFASKIKSTYRGNEVGVMHACGHDTHVSILMGVASTLAAVREDLPGSVLFIFQPAEEGAPEGEEGGAELMLKEGLFEWVKPDAVFGLHVTSMAQTGVIAYRSGPALASADKFTIKVKGRQTHGSRPWNGVDPISIAGQIITATQTLVSRQVDLTKAPAVVSFGIVEGGVRNNIIPDDVTLIGTIRNFDMDIRADIHQRLTRLATGIAESSGATAEVKIDLGYPVTINDPELSARMHPVLESVAGTGRVIDSGLIMGAEDFSYYAQQAPGLLIWLGVTPEGTDPLTAPYNHSPLFYVDESSLIVGVKALTQLTLNFMQNPIT